MGAMQRFAPVLAALAFWFCAADAQAAVITLDTVSGSSATATLSPDPGDVGKPADIWMGAVYQGTLYIRDGSTWVRHAGGPLPVAIRGQTLAAATPVTVVEQIDFSGLPGLDIYVGYGTSEQDMLTSPGKMAKIYTVPAISAVDNVAPITVDAGPPDLVPGALNIPFVSVTVCSPGSATNCQTIDHIHVDTGSTGLRLISATLSPSLALPLQKNLLGAPLAECVQFADATLVWGPVRLADVKIAGEHASSVPVQIIGDPAFSTVPPACSGVPSDTVQSFGAKGILGVGVFREDCGSYCAQYAGNTQYYACPASGCVGAAVPLAQQVAHPVARFARNNNGVLVQLPAIPAGGAVNTTGSLVFGIGTQANNGLGVAKVLEVDPSFGDMTTLYGGVAYMNSVIDSGANVLFLPSSVGIPTCSRRDLVAPGFLCPSATQTLSVINHGVNGVTDMVNFSVGNAHTLLSNFQMTAFNNLAAPNSDPYGFSWGLPFFFGRSVFTAIENAPTPGGTGPYVAY